jgi:hypothetical protein
MFEADEGDPDPASAKLPLDPELAPPQEATESALRSARIPRVVIGRGEAEVMVPE